MLLPHTAYVTSLAPPLAALSAAGLVLIWEGYRAGSAAWALPAAIAAETAWAIYLSQRYPAFLPWLTWIIAAVCTLSVAALTAGRLSRPLPQPCVRRAWRWAWPPWWQLRPPGRRRYSIPTMPAVPWTPRPGLAAG